MIEFDEEWSGPWIATHSLLETMDANTREGQPNGAGQCEVGQGCQ